MTRSSPAIPLGSFTTFGNLLKFLRRRAQLTQREVSIAVGYSEAQISRLEQNQRPPDMAAIAALFIPALYLEDEPELAARLMELAAEARGETLSKDGQITFSHSVRFEMAEITLEEGTHNNLPLSLTSFVGRRREIDEINNFLSSNPKSGGRIRLITLTGSGGSGKTRLALEVVRGLVEYYRNGVWLIELASISDPDLVIQAINSTFGIPESRNGMPTSTLTKFLRAKHTLLVLDNCEQVIATISKLVGEILRTCPEVQIMATSREILNIPGEVQFHVSPLSLQVNRTTDVDTPSRSEAVQLFVERARAALPAFKLTEENNPAITQICRLLDGIPLGIELAAAKIAVLSVEQIATRLQDNFHILGGVREVLPQHRTLEATIQWSFDLLSDSESVLLQRLAVFSGGWTLETAEAVASDGKLIIEERVLDLLTGLVNKSLVLVNGQTQMETRYRLLRIVEQYSYDRLEKSGELEALQERYLDFFLKMVELANTGLMSAQSPYWLDRLAIELNNLRSALAYGQSLKRYEDTMQLATGLFWFWQSRGNISEGRSHLEDILANLTGLPTHSPPTRIAARAKGLWAAGSLAWIQADYDKARSQLEESISLWRQLNPVDKSGLATSLREVGIVATYQGDLEYAHSALKESIHLLRKLGGKWNLALALYNQGLVYEAQNDLITAQSKFQESLSLFREINEPWGLSVSLYGFGRIASRLAEYDTARSHLEESLKLTRGLDDLWSSAAVLFLLGEIAQLQDNLERARELYIESLPLNQVVGDKAMIGFTFHHLGKIAQFYGDLDRGACLYGAAQLLRKDATNTTSWSLTDHAQCEQDIEALRPNLGDEAFNTAWVTGSAMSLDEAVEFALK